MESVRPATGVSAVGAGIGACLAKPALRDRVMSRWSARAARSYFCPWDERPIFSPGGATA